MSKQRLGSSGLYIMLMSIHGLVRGRNMELGRDADTGGQVKYVVELAKELSHLPQVARVDLVTRQIIDPELDPDYAASLEPLGEKAFLVRLPCGPRDYVRKEELWPYLDNFADNVMQYIVNIGIRPSVIHTHYADAGYVGTRVAACTDIPLIHTGHSLGREKLRRLLDIGLSKAEIEKEYNISQRIEAEERILEVADLVIASTQQESTQQYSIYDNFHADRMKVIAPGVDLKNFHPPCEDYRAPHIKQDIERFLHNPNKPIVLALSRPDQRKNIHTLVKAFAKNKKLRELANLLILAGNRDDISDFDQGPRKVLTRLLMEIDRYDLYGSVSIPKHHKIEDVPFIYQYVVKTGGVFVNPALTEPFGITLIEAGATGLPIVATNDGGPKDIIEHCNNGCQIDPLDSREMGKVLLDLLTDRKQWQKFSQNGSKNVREFYTWKNHARIYIQSIEAIIQKRTNKKSNTISSPVIKNDKIDRLIVCDIDNTLIGDRDGLKAILDQIESNDNVGFGVATGRGIESTLKILSEWKVPVPDYLITAVGSEIHYGGNLSEDLDWIKQSSYGWNALKIRQLLKNYPGIKQQAKANQRKHKISFNVLDEEEFDYAHLVSLLRKSSLHANVIYSHGAYLDILPIRSSKGLALRYLASKLQISPERILVAGDSGNDAEMLTGNTLGVVVANYSEEIAALRGQPSIYFAEKSNAWGVKEGIQFYKFFDDYKIA